MTALFAKPKAPTITATKTEAPIPKSPIAAPELDDAEGTQRRERRRGQGRRQGVQRNILFGLSKPKTNGTSSLLGGAASN